ncbi:translation initiation factor eIF2 gamma subunit [Phellopilus nigrolimitatus]|nr:translation initiation factor eIF2 gamma subunit [Phellopilus nigrolimitatus]
MSELVLNVTIKLGYANAKGCYHSYHSDKEDRPPCEVMDAALLLITGNGSFDLIKETQALGHQKSIAAFIKEGSARIQAPWRRCRPIIPISTQLKYNIDAVNEYIVKRIPIPPSAEVSELKNGVAGSSILAGVLTFGMHVEICPDIATKDAQGHNRCHPIFSCTVTLLAKNNQVQLTVYGGLIGVGTMINPTLCRADRLIGQIYTELEVSLFPLQCLLDIQTEDKKTAKVTKLVKNELLLINIGSTSTGGCVLSVKVNLKALSILHHLHPTSGSALALPTHRMQPIQHLHHSELGWEAGAPVLLYFFYC